MDEKALTVDALAQEIRRVDGNHSLGAGALAEALMPFIARALSPGSTGSAEAMVAALRAEIDHAAINDCRLPPAFGQRRGDLAVRSSALEAIADRFAAAGGKNG